MLIGIFSALYNIPRFCEVSWVQEFDPITNETYAVIVQTAIRANETYISIYITWLYLVVMYIVPFTCLAVFNFLIYMEVKKANKVNFAFQHLHFQFK